MYGSPAARRRVTSTSPYTIADLKAALAEVSGDAAFAEEFFARYIEGHEVVDYARLLARAGLVLRPRRGGPRLGGLLRLQDAPGGVRMAARRRSASPAYDAGLDRDDVIVSVGGRGRHDRRGRARAGAAQAGRQLPIVFDRRGRAGHGAIMLVEDPRREIVIAEDAGQPLTDAQRRFRDAWLRSVARAF